MIGISFLRIFSGSYIFLTVYYHPHGSKREIAIIDMIMYHKIQSFTESFSTTHLKPNIKLYENVLPMLILNNSVSLKKILYLFFIKLPGMRKRTDLTFR